jgi:hypothetical protein
MARLSRSRHALARQETPWISNWGAPSTARLSGAKSKPSPPLRRRSAHLLLQQIEIQRQTMDLLIRMDWDSNDHLTPTSDSEQAP